MDFVMLCCGLLMMLITIILMIGRIKTGKAMDYKGQFVALIDNPVYFGIATLFNFIFLLSISILMLLLAIWH